MRSIITTTVGGCARGLRRLRCLHSTSAGWKSYADILTSLKRGGKSICSNNVGRARPAGSCGCRTVSFLNTPMASLSCIEQWFAAAAYALVDFRCITNRSECGNAQCRDYCLLRSLPASAAPCSSLSTSASLTWWCVTALSLCPP